MTSYNNINDILVMGIETTCDDTAVSIIRGDKTILSNVIYSQIEEHTAFGGVVPEIAARAHVSKIENTIETALKKAACKISDISAFAGTAGPGLIGGVIVGTMVAKSLAQSLDKPYYAINHLEGHALSPRLTQDIPFPHLLLLISGGHTQILSVEDVSKYTEIGNTIDDAVGEAFDKVAIMLGLPSPGGKHIEQLAQNGDTLKYKFPHPLKGKDNCDFSFSGLKTAVKYQIDKMENLCKEENADIAASFQYAVTQCIVNRLDKAVTKTGLKTILIAGGVAANRYISDTLSTHFEAQGIKIFTAPLNLCTDNGAMIAWACIERMKKGYPADTLDFKPVPRWPLKEL